MATRVEGRHRRTIGAMKQWLRRSTILRSAAVPLTAVLASACAGSGPGDQGTLTYVVTGSPASVTYGPAGSSLSGTVPMRLRVPLASHLYYVIHAQLGKAGGRVTCRFLVNGHVVASGTAAGEFNVASCEISDGPGGWHSDL